MLEGKKARYVCPYCKSELEEIQRIPNPLTKNVVVFLGCPKCLKVIVEILYEGEKPCGSTKAF